MLTVLKQSDKNQQDPIQNEKLNIPEIILKSLKFFYYFGILKAKLRNYLLKNNLKKSLILVKKKKSITENYST